MKTLLKILGAILVCLILFLAVARITGFGPHDRTPGLWLKGNLVTTPVADWSFTDNIPKVKLQTQTWYLLPHSVTIDCVAYDGQLYLSSVYPAGTSRSWNDNALRDPRVRIKIGNDVYDRTLSLVTDPAEQKHGLQARSKKYPELRPELKARPNSTIHVFHVVG
jgi:hypothetical protein